MSREFIRHMWRFLGSVWKDTREYVVVSLVLCFAISLVAVATFASHQTLETINQVSRVIECVSCVILMLICASMFFRFLFNRLRNKWSETE